MPEEFNQPQSPQPAIPPQRPPQTGLPQTKLCTNCGAEINIMAKICPKCGVEQKLPPQKVSNWWFLLSIFFGFIGGIIAWFVNKDKNPKKAIILLIVGLVAPAFLWGGISASIVLVSLGSAREKAKEASVTSSMTQIRTEAEMYYFNQGDTYSGFNCDSNSYLINICTNIKEVAGKEPTIYSGSDAYCAYVKLEKSGYFCIDTTFSLGGWQKEIDPAGTGYCNGTTFSCP